jgi:hypothetical protein
MQPPRIDFWNIIFILFFALLTFIGYAIVLGSGPAPFYVDPWTAFILALATLRLTRLFVYDSITKWFRDLVEDATPRTFWGTVRTLVNCPWCTGLWSALVVSVVYFAWPQLWFFIFVMALGGGASILQIAANWIGWSAEFKKRATITGPERDQGSKCG